MPISATSAALLGAAIGGGATFGASWLQKTRDIAWQKARRDQDAIADFGRVVIKLNQLTSELQNCWGYPDETEALRKKMLAFEDEGLFLISVFIPELEDDFYDFRAAIDRVRGVVAEITTGLFRCGIEAKHADAMKILDISLKKEGARIGDPGLYEKLILSRSVVGEKCTSMMERVTALYRKRERSVFDPDDEPII